MILDGRAVAEQILTEVTPQIKELGYQPQLDVFVIGNHAPSEIYIAKKQQVCEKVGIKVVLHRFNEQVTQRELSKALEEAKGAILLQLPLPPHLDYIELFDKIDVLKDIEAFTSENIGYLVQGRPRFRPPTPFAVQQLLNRSGISVRGKHVVVINRSFVVGMPLSCMLFQDCDIFGNATVTVCHDSTPPEQLKEITLQADIIIVAVGIPHFLKLDMVKQGVVIVDVGVTRLENKIIGDVDPEVYKVASAYSLPTGGVGPVTIAMLVNNVLESYKLQPWLKPMPKPEVKLVPVRIMHTIDAPIFSIPYQTITHNVRLTKDSREVADKFAEIINGSGNLTATKINDTEYLIEEFVME